MMTIMSKLLMLMMTLIIMSKMLMMIMRGIEAGVCTQLSIPGVIFPSLSITWQNNHCRHHSQHNTLYKCIKSSLSYLLEENNRGY